MDNFPCPNCKKNQTEHITKRCQLYEEVSESRSQCVDVGECTKCQTVVCVQINGTLENVHHCLSSSDDLSGCYQVTGYIDFVRIFVLHNVICIPKPCNSSEDRDDSTCMYSLPKPHDECYILWHSGQAVGYCIIKPKGSPYSDDYDVYQLPVVDFVGVLPSCRRQGFATTFLQQVFMKYPNKDIGFSVPISDRMYEVLQKLLDDDRSLRDRLWQITDNGEEGCKKNVWYVMTARKRSKPAV